MNKLLQYLCGTSSRSPAAVYTNGRAYDLTTHTGALRWRVRYATSFVDYWRKSR